MFWRLSAYDDTSPLFIEHGTVISAGAFRSGLSELEARLAAFGRKTLGVISMRNTVDAVRWYVAALRSGHAVILIDDKLDAELLQNVLDRYQPDWTVMPAPAGEYHFETRPDAPPGPLYPELALLLSTSGSTGSPKLVRLSYANLASNAEAIAAYLALTSADRAVTTLPLHYSYGLSVLHSHLAVGGSVVMTQASVMEPAFWQALQEGVTSLAGVPFTWEMVLRLGFERKAPASLRALTQAGGRLDEAKVSALAAIAAEKSWRFYVMYGQTEATARISYVPPEEVAKRPGSIGVAIPGGALAADAETGELIYRGPNVMLGYAESREDLALGDVNQGVLHTGDLGQQDADGFWRITGRLKRFIKLFGLRINLQEVEDGLSVMLGQQVACTGTDERLEAWVLSEAAAEKAKAWLVSRYRLHPSAVTVRVIPELPRTASGKVDYPRLTVTAA